MPHRRNIKKHEKQNLFSSQKKTLKTAKREQDRGVRAKMDNRNANLDVPNPIDFAGHKFHQVGD